MSGAEITDWTEGKSFAPSMTMTVDGPAVGVLSVLASNLGDAGWTIKDQTESGFRARHINVLDWLSLEAGRSVLEVTAAERGSGVEVGIKVRTGGEHRMARRKGRAGLNAAVGELERDGRRVTVTPWQRPG